MNEPRLNPGPIASWQRRLRREVGWLLLAKLAALLLLWALFFSPAHRMVASDARVADRLAVEPAPADAPPRQTPRSPAP